jgi:two-component system cell cycle response regulator DivK
VSWRHAYVLVVDDSADSREMLTEYLRVRGFDVVATSNGASALLLAFADPPAVVLMDLRMPHLSGFETTRQLKAHPETKDVVVIALTALTTKTDQVLARAAGCDAFYSKPFDVAQIGDIVQAALERRRVGNLEQGAPSLTCPVCDARLQYIETDVSGTLAERCDHFRCPQCGPFEFRRRSWRQRAAHQRRSAHR